MRVTIVIPTYKEAGSIGTLTDELELVLQKSPQHRWSIVVVDANSPDGTGTIVRAKASQYKNIYLIEEPKKRGIAMAYLSGIDYAMRELKAEAFVEFDGDGQHDPRDIPRLVDELEKGYDCVIGSRYVPGGTIPEEWALHRKILSRVGGLYARILLELPVHDVTSGLKATRVSAAVASLPLSGERLLSRQYAYKLQFINALVLSGARMREIPIAFRMREHDISKSAIYDIAESLRVTLILRAQTLLRWRALRVLAAGIGLGIVIGFCMSQLLP